MSPVVLQRQAAMAGAALLAALAVVALQRSAVRTPTAPPPPSSSQPRWENAVVGVFGPARYGMKTACGVRMTPETQGIAHPVLPCGVDLILGFRGREVRAEVIDRGPAGTNSEFDVTRALASELGMRRSEKVRWRFAG